jgi:hypothetical protein
LPKKPLEYWPQGQVEEYNIVPSAGEAALQIQGLVAAKSSS